MDNSTTDANQPSKLKTQNSKLKTQIRPALLFWLVTGLAITLPVLRFVLRYAGVRPDTPFAGSVYSITAPFVSPFYRLFPVSDRFDYYAIEWASLVAAGCVVVSAILLYGVALLVGGSGRRSVEN